jgi:hypothetical protein
MSAPPLDPTASSLAQAVTRIGFRKWYERELMRGHAHLLLAVLSVIALLGSMEAFRGASVAAKLMDVGFLIACAAIGYWALRRYLYLLMRAETIANQATCASCGEYGRFDVVTDDRSRHLTEVCCRKCAHRWVIDSAN